MINIQSRFEKAKAKFLAEFPDVFDTKEISANDGDFGDLKGVQFDSIQCGGYFYFWSSGGIEYHLVDYELGDEILPITMRAEIEDADVDAALAEYLNTVKEVIASKKR